MRNILVGLMAGLFLLAVDAAHACRCLEPESSEVEFGRSVAVFEGTLVGYTEDVLGDAEFHVARVWKGDLFQNVLVQTLRGSTCEPTLEIGETYIIYAGEGTTAPLRATKCHRIVPVNDAADDLTYLGEDADLVDGDEIE